MNKEQKVLEEFEISELEDRVEFGLCGGGGGGGGGNPSPAPGPGPDCPTCEKQD